MFGCQLGELLLEIVSSFNGKSSEIVLLDVIVLMSGTYRTYRITKERVHVSIRGCHPRIFIMVEAAGEHLLGECDKVWSLSEIPLLVSPEAASGTYACLHLIDDEIDTELLRNILESLSKLSGDLSVAALAHNRLNDNSDDL